MNKLLFFLWCIWAVEGQSPPTTGLYFQLNNVIYMPGESVFITDIGNESNYRSDPMSSLVCVTTNVNRQCCRGSDGGRMGNWYYPNGTLVERYGQETSFHAKFYTHQVRLIRNQDGLEPLGNYTCMVSDYYGSIFNASINIVGAKTTLTSSLDVAKTLRDSVVFNCSIHSQDWREWDFIFTSPDNQILSSRSPGVVVDNSVHSVRLYTISPIRSSHAGLYTCVIIGAEMAAKALRVKLQPPLSVVILPLVQPVYATSSRTVVCYVQLQSSADLDLYLNVSIIPPANSTRSVQTRQVNVEGRQLHEIMFTLGFLRTSDSGEYSCSVRMSSVNSYVDDSDVTNGMTNIYITDVPRINVVVSSHSKPSTGHLYVLICSHSSSEINFIYSASFSWYHNGVPMRGKTSPVLILFSLTLSDVGNYTCNVNGTSHFLGEPIYGRSLPHEIVLTAPPPTSVQLTVSPSSIYVGTTSQLICSAIFSWPASIRLSVTMELFGPDQKITKQAVMESYKKYVGIFSIYNVGSQHSGSYNCSVVTRGSSLAPSPEITSSSIQLSVVGPPSPPVVDNVYTNSTSVYLSWSVSENELIDYFHLSYLYEVRNCHHLTGSDNLVINTTLNDYIILGLEENSDINITLTAINAAGSSFNESFQTFTEIAAPSNGPEFLRVVSVTSTSFTMAWDPVPCADRNTDILGYRIRYYAPSYHFNTEVDINQQDYKAMNLIPGTEYTFSVFPISNVTDRYRSQPRTTLKVTTETKDVGFFLNGNLLSNNSIVKLNKIGVRQLGLFCITNSANCCTIPYSTEELGNWIKPDQASVVTSLLYCLDSFTQNRRSSAVVLNHYNGFRNVPEGVFTCRIPDEMQIIRNVFIHIANKFIDIRVESLNYSRKLMTLTCISIGRPVNSIHWYKDGTVIYNYDPAYSQTQVLMNGALAKYHHIFSSDAKSNFQGRFTCVVSDAYHNTDRQTVMTNNCPPGQYGVVAFDGSTVCLQCPANSMSVSEGSNKCGCVEGYYRSDLEDPHFMCTRPPSKCRDLRVKDVSSKLGRVVLKWRQPIIAGRRDIYYNIYISSNSSNETFSQSNGYPVVVTEYTLSGLQPFTQYKIRVSANNGVSTNDKVGESKRICEVTWNM